RRRQDLRVGHMRRVKKTMSRHLSRPTAANLAQDQRSGLHHPLEQHGPCSLAACVSKKTDMGLVVTTHYHPLSQTGAALNHKVDSERNRKISRQGLLTESRKNAHRRNQIPECRSRKRGEVKIVASRTEGEQDEIWMSLVGGAGAARRRRSHERGPRTGRDQDRRDQQLFGASGL